MQTLGIQQQDLKDGEKRPYVLEIEETIPVSSIPEQVAQEISLEDGESELTHIGARPFYGVIEGSLKILNLSRTLQNAIHKPLLIMKLT